MILSIGMIVKNEEKYLDECLNALLPILENLESELIIVDTGSTDSTVEIAKKYTDKVYFFKWCDDFSAARNETLKYSVGEWYMYLDADEILQNASEIIDFFNSNEYKNYNCAKYKLTNFRDEEQVSHISMFLYRMYKRTQDTKFIGIIHEYITVPPNEKLLSNVEFYHYGYIKTDSKFSKKKSNRNINLLKKQLKQGLDNPRLRSQLSDSYISIGNYEEAIKHTKKGLKICKEKSLNYFYTLQINLLLAYLHTQDYTALVKEAIYYFNYRKEILVSHLDVFYMLSTSYYYLKQYDKCIDAFESYLKIFNEYKTKHIYTFELNTRSLLYTDDLSYNDMLNVALSAYINEKKYKEASDILKQPTLDKLNALTDRLSFFYSNMLLMKHKNNYTYIIILYNKLLTYKDGAYLDEFESIIERFLNEFPDEKNKIYSIIDSSDINTDYYNYIKINLAYTNKENHYKSKILNLINMISKIKNHYQNILYFIIDLNLPISILFNKIEAEDMSFFINNINYAYDDFLEKLTIYDYTAKNIFDNFILSFLYENILYLLRENDNKYFMDLYLLYIENFKKYLYYTYDKNILNEEYIYILPKNIRFGYYCLLAEKELSNGNQLIYIKYLKKALKENKNMKNLISKLLENFKNTQILKDELSEFEVLAITIKKNIINYIEENKLDEALAILNEYKLINPNDPDIMKLEKSI